VREGLAALRRRRALTPALAGAPMAAAPLTSVRAQRSRRQERAASRSIQSPAAAPADRAARTTRVPTAFTARPGASSGRVATPARPAARQESAPPPVVSPPAVEQAAEWGATTVTAGKLLEAKRRRRGG